MNRDRAFVVESDAQSTAVMFERLDSALGCRLEKSSGE
jgi:hypothetical protein